MDKIRYFIVTVVMIALNVLAFAVTEITGGSQNVQHMVECGAAYGPLILEKGEYYRLFTCMFLHFGIEHLLNNMLVLGVLGERLEPAVGHIKLLIIYLAGGLCGNLLSLYLAARTGDYAVSAGASGAVFAMMGALIWLVIRNRGRFMDLSFRRMFIMVALSVYLGFVEGGVDIAAHLGGMAGGFLLAVVLYRPGSRTAYN